MLLKSKDIEISPTDPFKNDLLGLEHSAKVLTGIVESSEQGFTLSVNADWGCGKTTFVKMWRAYLQNKAISSIYLNAWETDFCQDPMMALIDSLAEAIQSADFGIDKYKILSPIVDALIKTVQCLPAVSVVGHIAGAVKEGMDKQQEDRNELDKHRTYSSIVQEFRSKLSEFVENLPDKKLVIFIDELDRCRPTYSIEMLERIKHFFCIDNIIFVLSIDKSVMLQAIKGIYNSDEINAESYLRRFVDLEFELPKRNLSEFVHYLYAKNNLSVYEDAYSKRIDQSFNRKDNDYVFEGVLLDIFLTSNCSLRDVEKFFNRLVVSLCSLKRMASVEIIAILLYLYVFDRDTYRRLKEMEYNNIADFILAIEESVCKSVGTDNDYNYISYIFDLAHLYARYVQQEHSQIDLAKGFSLEQFSFKRLSISKDDIKRIWEQSDAYRRNAHLSMILPTIELVSEHFTLD